jgi:hypothetical protein
MTRSESLKLPPTWQFEETAGGVDLRVSSSGRGYVIAAFGILAILSSARTIIDWNRGWLLLTFCLAFLALWCAFADEVWRLETNCVMHRIGIGSWCHCVRYQNADLEIRLRFNKWGRAYYRLYAVEDGNVHFLIERGEQDLMQLAEFISYHTGWPIDATGKKESRRTDSK